MCWTLKSGEACVSGIIELSVCDLAHMHHKNGITCGRGVENNCQGVVVFDVRTYMLQRRFSWVICGCKTSHIKEDIIENM